MMLSSLPDVDLPEVFSLPPNSDQAAQRSLAERVVGQLRLLPRLRSAASASSAGTGITQLSGPFEDRAAWLLELNPLLVLWKKLNQGSNIVQVTCFGKPHANHF
ncbi:unnamed protein product [Protopolystoma xenopodis]|uniref:Uncharacterized protein n=1 Tax=Protopolystoma xenopodis TaxID=117903 RepID=A0A448WVY9_9PLAT|nr:unnamed protein product [Protopolystoma xenopodis]